MTPTYEAAMNRFATSELDTGKAFVVTCMREPMTELRNTRAHFVVRSYGHERRFVRTGRIARDVSGSRTQKNKTGAQPSRARKTLSRGERVDFQLKRIGFDVVAARAFIIDDIDGPIG